MTVWTPGTTPLTPQTAVWSDADNYRGPQGPQGARGVPGEDAFTITAKLPYPNPITTFCIKMLQ